VVPLWGLVIFKENILLFHKVLVKTFNKLEDY
jgi:hypothetical protein